MVYVFTHVLRFPDNRIIAWTIDNYHEQGNIIITILLLPLGHISNNMVKTWCDIRCCMRWSCFVKVIGNWQEPYGCRLLYEMHTPCNCFTLPLCVTIVVEAIVGETTMTLQWRSRCQADDYGDHDIALEVEIKSTRWWWPYHVTYFDCMWCLSFRHLILLSTVVAL